MTAAAVTLPGDRGRDAAPSLVTLTRVELRKMVDTRSGMWLTITVAALTVVVGVIVALAGNDEDRTLRELANAVAAPAAILLPVIGILLVASEWSQRTALTTFTLTPRRARVLGAKLLAGTVLALVFLVAAWVVALVIALAAAPDTDGAMRFPGWFVGQQAVMMVVSVAMGVAFGAAVLSPAPAIVLYFVLPTVIGALGTLSFLEGVADWLDFTQTTTPMGEHALSGEEWGQFAVSALLWLGVPLLIGARRILRGEIRV